MQPKSFTKKFGVTVKVLDSTHVSPSSLEVEKLPTFILHRLKMLMQEIINPSDQVIIFNIHWYANCKSPVIHYINIYEYYVAESFENFHWISPEQYTEFIFMVNTLGINIIPAMASVLGISEEKLYAI